MSTSDDIQGILGRSTWGVEDGVCFRDLAGKENLLQGQSDLSERHTWALADYHRLSHGTDKSLSWFTGKWNLLPQS